MHVMACNLACNMTCNRARRGRSGAVRSGAQRRPGTLRRSLKVSMAILICGHKVTARYAPAPAAHGGPRRRAAAGADGRAGTLRSAVAALRPRRYAAASPAAPRCGRAGKQRLQVSSTLRRSLKVSMAIVICHLRPHGNVVLFPTFDSNSGFSNRPPRRPRRAAAGAQRCSRAAAAAAAPVRGRLDGRAALRPRR